MGHTMTRGIDELLAKEGLTPVLTARRAGESTASFAEKLATADILVLGALADLVRAEEVGGDVRITLRPDAEDADAGAATVRVHVRDVEPAARGLALLRDVAVARLTAPRGARVVVDWTESGLELAEVALSFGASALSGPIVSKRGLPIAEDKTKKVKGQGMVSVASLKQKELAEIIRRTGRTPVWVDAPPPDTRAPKGAGHDQEEVSA